MSPYLAVLLLAAVALIQCLTGGSRLLFALPGYAFIGVAAVLAVFSLPKVIPRATIGCVASAAILAGYAVWRALSSPMEYYAW